MIPSDVLKEVADLGVALGEIQAKFTDIQIQSPLEVRDNHDDVMGYLFDEIGEGPWMFSQTP